MSKKWVCQICGHEHEGETAPDVCPVCGALTESFQIDPKMLLTEAKRARSTAGWRGV